MQPGGRAGGGGGGGVRDNKMEGEKERVGEREKERRQGEQLKPLLLPPSPLLPRLPPPSALAHPDHCAPGGVQEINGRMLTTFDRLHKRGHLGSHDATCTPPPHPHLTPTSPHLTPTSPPPHPGGAPPSTYSTINITTRTQELQQDGPLKTHRDQVQTGSHFQNKSLTITKARRKQFTNTTSGATNQKVLLLINN